MADRDGWYWDYVECGWVRADAPLRVDIPEQPTGVSEEREADVRSG